MWRVFTMPRALLKSLCVNGLARLVPTRPVAARHLLLSDEPAELLPEKTFAEGKLGDQKDGRSLGDRSNARL